MPLVGAKVIVWNKAGHLLVIRRSETDPRRPLTWDLPGGILDEGEDPSAAAMREVLEETGISLDNVHLVDTDLAQGFELYIFQSTVARNDVELSWEHDQHRWVTLEELQQLNIPGKYKRAVKRALERR